MGNTQSKALRPNVQWDHPHIYGEYDRGETNGTAAKGSPPYIWGIPLEFLDPMALLRITPIYMGNTNPRSLPS